MLRERALGESLWESVLPEELRELPPELAKVDEMLDEDRFLAPFRRRLTATTGRPTIPIETYLRLMYLKHRYELGWETLCKEVSDSFTWRRFCRIALDGRVPDPTTLMKLTKRLGPELVEELNAELLSLAVERKVLRSRRLRVDTTIVEADIRSPTDSGSVRARRLAAARLARRVKAAGARAKARLRDRRRSVGKRVRAISAARVRGRRRARDDRPADRRDRRAGEADRARGARSRRAGARRSRRPRARVLAGQLERELEAAEQILAQTDLRLAGPAHDPRPARLAGRPRRPPDPDGQPQPADRVRLQGARRRHRRGLRDRRCPRQAGNPTDDRLLDGAIAKAKDAGMRVDCVYADRGFGTSTGDAALAEHASTPGNPPPQQAAPIEATRAWRRRYRFRNGLEGRISQLKRKGLRRTRLRDLPGAQTWVGGIALAHNLQRMALLT